MRLAVFGVGLVLLLVSIGLTLVRTGHPRAVAPLLVALLGLLVMVAGVVVVRSPARTAARSHRAAPTVATTSALATTTPAEPTATAAATCTLRLPAPARGRLPGPQPSDAQKLPSQFPALPGIGGPLLLSHAATPNLTDVPDTVGGALVDYATARYYLPPNDGQFPLTVAIGTPRTTACGHDLVTTALRDNFAQPGQVMLIDPGPHLAGYSAWFGCGAMASGIYNICAWAVDQYRPKLFGEMIFRPNMAAMSNPSQAMASLSYASLISDMVFGVLSAQHL